MAIQGSNNSITTSPTALSSTSQPFDYGVRIKADPSNTQAIALGFTGAAAGVGLTYQTATATDGYVLAPGDEVPVPVTVVANVANIFVLAASGTQRAQWYGT
jgi:hypothetical protein